MTDVSMKLLNAALNSADLPNLMTGQETHGAALKFVSALVRAGADDELIESLVKAALPPSYGGNTLAELPAMIKGARDKGFAEHSDEVEASEGGTAKQRFARRDKAQVALEATLQVVNLFHDGNRSYLSVPTEAGGHLCHAAEGAGAQKIIRKAFYEVSGGQSIPARTVADVVGMLVALAQDDGQQRPVYRRVGRDEGVIFVDLGTATGEVVQINPQGFSVLPTAPLAFVRDDTMESLPYPEAGGDLHELADLLQVDGENTNLLFGFLLNCLRGVGPYMCLMVEGPQGSGKSVLCEAIKRLIDPNTAHRMRLPSDEQELMLHAMNFFLPVYDNASGMKGDISDTLCSIATGATIVKRTLFTNLDLSVVRAQRPFIINGIGDFANQRDLLQRAIFIQLKALEQRSPEKELWTSFEAKLPKILGALYAAASLALREEMNTPPPEDIRMIDAARWVTAAEPAIGVQQGAFVAALKVRQLEVSIERNSSDPVVEPLRQVLEAGPFYGTVGTLHAKICAAWHGIAGMPNTPLALSRYLKRMGDELATIGIHVQFEPKTNKGKPVRIWKDGQSPHAGQAVQAETETGLFRLLQSGKTKRQKQCE